MPHILESLDDLAALGKSWLARKDAFSGPPDGAVTAPGSLAPMWRRLRWPDFNAKALGTQDAKRPEEMRRTREA